MTCLGSWVDGEVPNETAGPFPGDGSNGTNVLDDSGIVRSDIRSSLDGSGAAEGVPLTFRITVRDLSTGKVMVGAGVYVWHCDRDGNYSMYSSGNEDKTFLRGVQGTDDAGTVEYTSIFPGCYSGRWPHIHFEVYATSVGNLAQLSLATDNVFGDDQGIHQLATVTGSVEDGYVASLTIGVDGG
jgi:protocatechuate 3,4-dioxygenase beta subunit